MTNVSKNGVAQKAVFLFQKISRIQYLCVPLGFQQLDQKFWSKMQSAHVNGMFKPSKHRSVACTQSSFKVDGNQCVWSVHS